MAEKKMAINETVLDLNKLCDMFLDACKAKDKQKIAGSLNLLRKTVLFQGIPDEEDPNDDLRFKTEPTLRGKVWKALLGIDTVEADYYMNLIKQGTCEKYDKIRGDSFRTFPDDQLFKDRVSEARIIRVLNSFVHEHKDSPFSYVQGMNAISAPLLYCMPEVDAYFAFRKLIVEKFPLYWVNDIVGAQAACYLVDEILDTVDPKLSAHLRAHNLTAYIYGFSCVSSLSASIPPFKELLKLWDFLVAFGLHLNIVCTVAQVICIREKLLASNHPGEILNYRKWPPLRARQIISVTVSLLAQIPAALFDKICQHPTNAQVTSAIVGRDVTQNVKTVKGKTV